MVWNIENFNELIKEIRAYDKNGKKKRFIFIRHADTGNNHQDFDPGITKLGEKQAYDFAQTLKGKIDDLDLIIVSPMRRTLQTAQIISDNLINQVPIVACPLIREVLINTPYNKGSSGNILMDEFKNLDIEWPQWGLNNGEWPGTEFKEKLKQKPINSNLLDRLCNLPKWLQEQFSKKNINGTTLIITHGSFLQEMFNYKYKDIINCEAFDFYWKL